MISNTRVVNPVTGRQIFLCPMNWDNGQFESGGFDFLRAAGTNQQNTPRTSTAHEILSRTYDIG